MDQRSGEALARARAGIFENGGENGGRQETLILSQRPALFFPARQLFFVLAFFLLLFAVVVVLAAVFALVRLLQLELALGPFLRLALFLFLKLPRLLVVLPGLEDEMQPRHHLVDRGQPPGRAGGSGFSLRAGFSLWPRFAAFSLRPGLAHGAARCGRTGLSDRSWMTLAARLYPASRDARAGPAICEAPMPF